MGVSYGCARRVPKEHLCLFPCKITSMHELKERGSVRCVEYCQRFRDIITANGEDVLHVTFFVNDA
jgi:hypothetical protein